MQQLEKDAISQALDDCKKARWFILMISLASNVLMLGLPIYTLQLLDRVMSTGSMPTLVMLTTICVGMFVFFGLFQLARTMAFVRMGEWLNRRLSGRLIENTVMSAAMFQNVSGGQNLRDLSTIRSFVTGAGMVALSDVPFSVLFFLAVFMIHGTLGMVSLIGGASLLGLAILNEFAMREPLNQANEKQVRNYS
ncbi:MAG: type I secretion system permease/ATPase, partial [Rickettsiales bacterium]|nr:type I secretion system permease/ATPase [Rickettsiales bacterium]